LLIIALKLNPTCQKNYQRALLKPDYEDKTIDFMLQ